MICIVALRPSLERMFEQKDLPDGEVKMPGNYPTNTLPQHSKTKQLLVVACQRNVALRHLADCSVT